MFGESRNVRFAYAHLPLGTEKADFTFRVPEGVEVYDSDGEKLEQAKGRLLYAGDYRDVRGG